MNHRTKRSIRKAHRVLGVALGIQFLLWTVSGFYFSWTDLDQIHGDDFNTILLRAFSLFGLITVISGFLLFFISQKAKRQTG